MLAEVFTATEVPYFYMDFQLKIRATHSRSRRFRIEFGIPNEIIRKYSETAWKFGLCHFLGLKKCGNLNFVIFYVGKSAESWTLLFLLAKKVRKVGK